MARFSETSGITDSGEILVSGSADKIVLSDAATMFQGEYSRQGPDLVLEGPDGTVIRVLDYYSSGTSGDLYSEAGAVITADVVNRLAGAQNPMAYAQVGTPTGQQQIGQVETLEGQAFATRANGQRVELQVGDPVFEDDLIETADDANLGLTFIDETVFSLSANARMILDELVYEPGGSNNSMVMNLVQGTFVFVTGQVAPSGEMLVETPVATMGIRGTTPIVIVEGDNGKTEFGILKDPDGKIGAYEIRDKVTGLAIDRVIDEGTILQLDQAGGTPSSITVDATRLAERAEAQSNAYFLHTVARARISSQQQNNDQQNQDGQPVEGADPITTESIGETTNPDSGDFDGFDVDVSGDEASDEGDGSEDGEGESENGDSTSDGVSGSSSGAPNVAPTTIDQTFQLSEDVGIAQGGLAATDTDSPGSLSYTIIDQPALGAVLSNGDGTFTFIADPIFNTLQEGEVTAVSFTYQAEDVDGGVSNVSTVTLQILGVNDLPIATVIDAGITNEDADQFSVDLLSTALDPDFGDDLDTQNVTVTSSNASRAAIFAINDETGAFSLDPNQFTDLAVGESETLTINYTIIDGFGGSTTNVATVVMEGRNDLPEIIAVNVTGNVTDIAEDAEDIPASNAGDQSAQGSITFTDVDLSDRPVASETTKSVVARAQGGGEIVLTEDQLAGIEGAFTITAKDSNTNDGTVDWDYTIAESSLDFLGEGETVTAIFTITIDDTNGGVVTQDVIVEIGVAVDAPVITAETVTGTINDVAESANVPPANNDGPLNAIGLVTFADVDLTDRPVATDSVKSVSATNQAGDPLVLTTDQQSAIEAAFSIENEEGNVNDGAVSWDYTIQESAVDFLGEGETVTATFTITVTDDEGATDVQDVVITINGANDAPVITPGIVAGTINDVPEATDVPPITNDGPINTMGSITFADVDLTDNPTATEATKSVTALGQGGGALALTVAQQAAIEAAFSISEDEGNANAGGVSWNYTIQESAVDFLGEGDTVTATFTITITDDEGATDVQDVVITINGANDAPVITAGIVAGTINDVPEATEVPPTTNDGPINAMGSITFADVDLTDNPTATEATKSVTAVGQGGAALALTAAQQAAIEAAFSISEDEGNANDGGISWDYTIQESAIDFLGEGETVTATFTITVTDDEGATDVQDVVITINGANDAPVITPGNVTGTINDVAEAAEETPSDSTGNLNQFGRIVFADVDLMDNPSATEATKSVTAIGQGGTALALTVAQQNAIESAFSIFDEEGNANDGQVNWDYTIAESAVDFLGTGDVITAKFTITVTDDEGAKDTQDVTITINGENDAPVIGSGDILGGVTEIVDTLPGENSVDLSSSGTLAFSDTDLTDTHSVAVSSVSATDSTNGTVAARGSLLPVVTNSANGDGTGEVTWTFTVNDGALDDLSGGQTITQTYSVTVTDGAGATDTETVTITITGTEDAPIITGTADGAVAEDGTLIANGALVTSDADAVDTPIFIAQTGTAGTHGSFDVTTDGAWTYTLDNAVAQGLTGGEIVTETFVVTAMTADGEIVTQPVTVTVTGAEDAPIITGTASGGVTEDGTLTANGTLVSTDADASDIATFAPQTGTAGVLGVFNFTSTGDWTYTLDNEAAQGLASGEIVTETFTVTATTADGESVTQPVTIIVTGTEDAPIITGTSSGTATEDVSLVATGTLATSDADTPDIPTFTAQTGSFGAFGLFDITTGGVWTYTLNNDAAQSLADGQVVTEAFFVTARTADGESALQAVTVTITGTNDVPSISAALDAGTITEDAPAQTINLLANASDADTSDDLDTANVTATSDNTGRSVTFSVDDETGSLTLDPNQFNDLGAGESETVTFQYDVTDGTASTPTTATLVVEAAPEAPGTGIAMNDSAGIFSDGSPQPLDLLSNDRGMGNGLTFVEIAGIAIAPGGTASIGLTNGILNLDASGNLTYTPNAGIEGEEVFSYVVSDINGTTGTANVTLNIFGGEISEIFDVEFAETSLTAAANTDPVLDPTGDMDLTSAELSPIVDAAIARWSESGLNEDQIEQLQNISFEIADLGGDTLGRAEDGRIILDDDAGGRGWFIDATPLEDSEFANALTETHLSAEAGQISESQIDLLTAVLHEFGHELGLTHIDGVGASGDLLFDELGTGERRLPTEGAAQDIVLAHSGPDAPIANDDGKGGEFKIVPGGSIDILVSELLANDIDPNGEAFDLTDVFADLSGTASLETTDAGEIVRFTADAAAGDGDTIGFQYEVTNESGGVGFAMVDIIIDDMSTAV